MSFHQEPSNIIDDDAEDEEIEENEQHYQQLCELLLEADEFDIFAPQLTNILLADNEHAHFGVTIDAQLLLHSDTVLCHKAMRRPTRILELLTMALVIQEERLLSKFTEQNDPHPQASRMTFKENLHARIQWLPAANRKATISSIRARDVGNFLQFTGTVIRAGSTKVLEHTRVFECGNPKCELEVSVFAALDEVGGIVEKPSGKCDCGKSSTYTELKNKAVWHDYQEIKVQEQVQRLGMGSIPRSIVVLLLHDLVNGCKPGDDVVITGVSMFRWGNTYKDERVRLETVIRANTVYVMNSTGVSVSSLTEAAETEFGHFWEHWNARSQPYTARNAIVRSICPQLYGLFMVKLTLLLTLIGSPAYADKSGNRVRGQPHLLLIGDPGTGKSQFLRFAARLSPRAVLTTGVGTTSAGLTCAAVREGNEFMLEAGALVLADRGLCCIDEFGSIRSSDRSTILEAMEQQTLSVAKAGIVCTLNTRTTIIAACNPKGKYDPMANLTTNVGIEAPLLSRFDVVLVMLDVADEEWDRNVSEFILKTQLHHDETTTGGPTAASRARRHKRRRQRRKQRQQQQESTAYAGSVSGSSVAGSSIAGGSMVSGISGRAGEEEEEGGENAQGVGEDSEVWTLEKLQDYIQYVKRIEPSLSLAAGRVLSTYYKAQRLNDSHMPSTGRTTLRLLESLIRMAKAHARLMAQQEATVRDAVVAIMLVEMSMNTFNALGQESVVNYDFPIHPEQEFFETQQRVLKDLKLEHLVTDSDDGNDTSGGPPSTIFDEDDFRDHTTMRPPDSVRPGDQSDGLGWGGGGGGGENVQQSSQPRSVIEVNAGSRGSQASTQVVSQQQHRSTQQLLYPQSQHRLSASSHRSGPTIRSRDDLFDDQDNTGLVTTNSGSQRSRNVEGIDRHNNNHSDAGRLGRGHREIDIDMGNDDDDDDDEEGGVMVIGRNDNNNDGRPPTSNTNFSVGATSGTSAAPVVDVLGGVLGACDRPMSMQLSTAQRKRDARAGRLDKLFQIDSDDGEEEEEFDIWDA